MQGGAYYKLLGIFQCRGEAVSSYLLCLEQVLQCVASQGALHVVENDHVRFQQVQIGAQYHLSLIQDLHLAGRKDNPPGFSQLMKEVREEEEILH